MPTQTKIDEVARLKEKLENAISLVLADYRGLTANEMVELREKFTKQGLEYRVVKDTLARLAADEAGIEGLADLFEGPISIAFGYEDPVVAFKLSEECRKTYASRYELKGGVFEGVLVPESEVARYATLPSREELLAKLVMLLSSPMRAMAFMLRAKIRELATVLAEVAKVREQEPDQPAVAEASENPAAEEPQPEAQEEEPAEETLESQEDAEQPEDQPEEESQEASEEQEEKQEEEA
jgi:large subunit ribosomal protein L10